MNRTLRILVVDDEEIIRRTLVAILQRLGHCAEDARDGPGGLRSIENGDYDAAFVDVRMPGLDGLDVLCKAKEIKHDIRIIMMSGNGFDDTRNEAMQKGAFAFVQKPLRIMEIQELIRNISACVSPQCC